MANAALFDGRFVILGRRFDVAERDERLAIWTSQDGRSWQGASVEGISAAAHDTGNELEVHDLTVGGPGLIAVGRHEECCGAGVNGAVWVSDDADTWTMVFDEDFHYTGGLYSTWSDNGLVYAFGDAGLFSTSDGVDWAPVAIGNAPSDYLREGIKADQSMTYFVGTGESRTPLEVWRLNSSGWVHLGQLPDSNGATFQQGAGGSEGWVILGERYRRGTVESLVWVSHDGTTWEPATSPPSAFVATDVMVDDAGFVAAGYEYPAGCAWDWGAANGRTWSSSDGLVWQESSTDGWQGQFIGVLLRSGRTLIGVGADHEQDEDRIGAVWTARLPQLDAAEPREPPEPTQVGCG